MLEFEAIDHLRNTTTFDASRVADFEHLAIQLLNAYSRPKADLTPNLIVAISSYIVLAGQPSKAQAILRRLIPLLTEERPLDFQTTHNTKRSRVIDYIEARIEPTCFGESTEVLLNLIDLQTGLSWPSKVLRNLLGRFTCLSINEIFTSLIASHPKRLEVSNHDLHENKFTNEEPSNSSERLNILHQDHFSTFWLDAIRGQGISLVTDTINGIKRIKPNGSFLIDRNCGSIIGFPFVTKEATLIPLYSGWVNHIEGLVIIRSATNETAVILNSATILSADFELVRESISYFIDNELNKWAFSLNEDGPYLLVGQRINYGHTVINDLCSLSLLSFFVDNKIGFNLALGKWDFISTVEILQETGRDIIKSSDKWITINEFQTDREDLYSFPSTCIFPVPTMRPPSKSLDIIDQVRFGSVEAKETCYNAYMLQLDNRQGARKCKNQFDVIHSVLYQAKTRGINYVVIDGYTGIPSYRKVSTELAAVIAETTLSQEIKDYVYKEAQKNKVSIVWIDGLSLCRKLVSLRSFSIIKALAPYGSGAMTPIYLINADTGLFGHETYSNVREAWKWHITKYCHSYRRHEEIYIDSTLYDNTGYIVDLDSVRAFIDT